MHMNGKEVFKMAVTASIDGIRYVLDKTGLNADQVDHYICHQANMRILEAIRTTLQQPKEKFPHNIERTGEIPRPPLYPFCWTNSIGRAA